ncbi:MAG: helix-turn-helix domain-containing protein [Marinoscillum sp.]
MRFDKYIPTERLRPYIKYFVVSESDVESSYKVYPTSGLVIGFQYCGQLSVIQDSMETSLSHAGITGITNGYKQFKNSVNTGTVLIYFTEIGFTHFTSHPAHELFNLSLSLDDIFDKNSVMAVSEKLRVATSDIQRIRVVEQFLSGQIRPVQTDRLIAEAIKLIYQSSGTIRIKELNDKLAISQSPFEKRFRKVVGTTPKKFASIVRFNIVLDNLKDPKSLTEISYENGFFDQAHFSKDFRQFTGDSPESFKRFL